MPITDYYHSDGRPTGGLFGSKLNVSSDVLRDLNAKYTSLEDERQLRQKSFAFLSTYMDSLAQGKVPANFEAGPAQLVKFFDEFVELGKSRSEVIAVLDQEISDVQQAISEETKQLQHEHSCLAVTATVVLAPLPTNTVDAVLELVYSKLSCNLAATFSSHYPHQESRPHGNQYTKCMSPLSMVSLPQKLFSNIDAKYSSTLGRIGTM